MKALSKAVALLLSPPGIVVACGLSVGSAFLLQDAPARLMTKHEVLAPIPVKVAAVKVAAPAQPTVAPKPVPVQKAASKRAPTKKPAKRYAHKHTPSASVQVRTRPKFHKNWKTRRDAVMQAAQSKEMLRRRMFIDSELNADFASDATVVNGWDLQSQELDRVLDEAPSDEGEFEAQKTRAAQVDVELALDLPFVEAEETLEKVGLYEQNGFAEIREQFAQLDAPLYHVWRTDENAPEPMIPKAEPVLAKAPAPVPTPVAAPVATPAPALVSEKAPEPVKDEPSISVAPALASVLAPSVAQVIADPTPKKKPPKAVAQKAKPAPATVSTPAPVRTAAASTRSVPIPNDVAFEEDLFGRLIVSNDLERWLADHKAHLELYLQPVGTRDPQGTRYLTYQFPQKDFREDAKALKGRYRLVAGVFRRQDVDLPYGEIVYPQEINANTARSHLKFFADVKNIVQGSHSASANRKHVKLSVSLFEGASGEYRTPKEIPAAEIQVVGFPEYGTLNTDADGNLTISALPNHSQVVLEIRAKGYFRTFRTVPLFGADVHVPVYLISVAKVAAIATNLVGVRQAKDLSTVMGRVFDPQTRNPLEGEAFEMVNQPAQNGNYFGLLVDALLPRTTAMGFWSYFNVASAFRYIVRPESDKRPYRLNVRPGTGYYVELGRGGMTSFKGRLLDPNQAELPEARIRLVGDEKNPIATNADGTFEIPNIDFPSGVLAIDVEAPGYPLTRHTVAWNPRQTNSVRDLFMVQDHFVEESIASSQSTDFGPNPDKFRHPAAGNLIGGAYGALFEGLDGCLRVELWSVDSGKTVASSHGPFPFRGGTPSDQLCLISARPGFNYINLPPGEYLLKWKNDQGHALGARIVHIGMGRNSVAVN